MYTCDGWRRNAVTPGTGAPGAGAPLLGKSPGYELGASAPCGGNLCCSDAHGAYKVPNFSASCQRFSLSALQLLGCSWRIRRTLHETAPGRETSSEWLAKRRGAANRTPLADELTAYKTS